MKFLQKRSVAAAVMVLAILAGVGLGQARKPSAEAALTGGLSVPHPQRGRGRLPGHR